LPAGSYIYVIAIPGAYSLATIIYQVRTTYQGNVFSLEGSELFFVWLWVEELD
jgi:hypothetical protein